MIEDKSKHVHFGSAWPSRTRLCRNKMSITLGSYMDSKWSMRLITLFLVPMPLNFFHKEFCNTWAFHQHKHCDTHFQGQKCLWTWAPSCDKRISQLQARFLSWPLAFSQSFYWHSKLKTLYIYIYSKYIVRASPPQACKHPFSLNLGPG